MDFSGLLDLFKNFQGAPGAQSGSGMGALGGLAGGLGGGGNSGGFMDSLMGGIGKLQQGMQPPALGDMLKQMTPEQLQQYRGRSLLGLGAGMMQPGGGGFGGSLGRGIQGMQGVQHQYIDGAPQPRPGMQPGMGQAPQQGMMPQRSPMQQPGFIGRLGSPQQPSGMGQFGLPQPNMMDPRMLNRRPNNSPFAQRFY